VLFRSTVNNPAYITYTARITEWLAVGVVVTNGDAQMRVGNSVDNLNEVDTTINAVPGPRYVSQAGDNVTDTNNCRMDWKPCKTVQYAVNQALSGDPVYVAGGIYSRVEITKSLTLTGGHDSNWIYDPQDNPTSLDAGGSAQGVVITGPLTVTLSSLHILNGDDGIYASDSDLTLKRLWVHSNTHGVRLENSTYRLDNSVIANNGTGLQADASSQGSLRHDTFARNADFGAVISDTASFTNTIFYSHTVAVSATGSAELWRTLWSENITATQGTVTDHDALPVTDPAFIDPDGLDYHIQGDSGAIGAGMWIGVDKDVDNDTRPAGQAPDVGADQYPLRVSRWASPDDPLPCQTVTQTLVLTNITDSPLVGVRLTDTLPISVTYNDSSIAPTSGSGGYLESQSAVVWTGNVTDSVRITYTVNVSPYLTAGTVITFSGVVSDSASSFSTGDYAVTVRTTSGDVQKRSADTASIGEVITYTITYTIPQGHMAYQPVITDTLPRLVTESGISETAALTYVTGSAVPSVDTVSGDGTLTWTLPSVAADCSGPRVEAVTFAAQVLNLPDNDTGDVLTNNASLSYTDMTADGSPYSLTTDDVVTLTEPHVSITKAMMPNTKVGAGEDVVITLTVVNTGTSTLYDMLLTDTLPDELTFQDATGGDSPVGQTISWTDDLAVGTAIYTITARVTDTVEAEQTLTNTAEVEGTSQPGAVSEERTYSDATEVLITTGTPELTISKDGPATSSPGQPIAYTIIYTNIGEVNAAGVQVTDTLPIWLTDIVSTTTSPATVTSEGRAITWTLGTVAPSTPGTILITGTVMPKTPEETVLTNTTGIVATLIPTPTTDLVTTTVYMPDLVGSKAGHADTVVAGDELTYTLTIINNGLGDATGVVVTDHLPVSVTLGTATPSQGTCGDTVPVTCALGTMTPGASATITIFGVVDPSARGVIVNQAGVAAVQPTTDTFEESTNVNSEVDLVISKRSKPDQVIAGAGETVTYTLTITNAGPSDAWDVWVTDTLPAGVAVTNVEPVTTAQSGRELGWDVGALPVGDHSAFTVTAIVESADAQTLTNTAEVTSTVTERDDGDNKDTATTTVVSNYTLTTHVNPADGGSVTLNPSGGVYDAGTVVTLTASANSDWAFDRWTGDTVNVVETGVATVTMNSDKVITATFTEVAVPTYTLTINTVGQGTVTTSPDRESYDEGTDITLEADAADGWQFDNWSGDLTGSTNPDTITMDANKVVTATFVESDYYIYLPLVIRNQ